MSKKKGLSAEEKQIRLLELFHEKKDVFLLKELEKIAPKEKGITMQSVKEVVTVLVSDDKVETDKIGSSTYFWAFPSKDINKKIQEMEELKKSISEMKSKSKRVESELKKYEIDEKERADRDRDLHQLKALQSKRDKLKARLGVLKDFDPELLEEMKKECLISKDAVNRWTDNVFSIKSWIKEKFLMEDSEVNKNFGIPEDMDYLE